MFGTFQPEDEVPVYGITKDLRLQKQLEAERKQKADAE